MTGTRRSLLGGKRVLRFYMTILRLSLNTGVELRMPMAIGHLEDPLDRLGFAHAPDAIRAAVVPSAALTPP